MFYCSISATISTVGLANKTAETLRDSGQETADFYVLEFNAQRSRSCLDQISYFCSATP